MATCGTWIKTGCNALSTCACCCCAKHCQCQKPQPAPAEEERILRGWRPFESAPDDGSEILVYRPDAGVFVAVIRDETWFSVCGYDLTGDLPTHWMSIPQGPPVVAEEERLNLCRNRGQHAVDNIALRAECDQLRKALEAVEWAGLSIGNMEAVCPSCDETPMHGHAPDCIVGLAMGKCGLAEASPR
jgi:hypothetical protein